MVNTSEEWRRMNPRSGSAIGTPHPNSKLAAAYLRRCHWIKIRFGLIHATTTFFGERDGMARRTLSMEGNAVPRKGGRHTQGVRRRRPSACSLRLNATLGRMDGGVNRVPNVFSVRSELEESGSDATALALILMTNAGTVRLPAGVVSALRTPKTSLRVSVRGIISDWWTGEDEKTEVDAMTRCGCTARESRHGRSRL